MDVQLLRPMARARAWVRAHPPAAILLTLAGLALSVASTSTITRTQGASSFVVLSVLVVCSFGLSFAACFLLFDAVWFTWFRMRLDAMLWMYGATLAVGIAFCIAGMRANTPVAAVVGLFLIGTASYARSVLALSTENRFGRRSRSLVAAMAVTIGSALALSLAGLFLISRQPWQRDLSFAVGVLLIAFGLLRYQHLLVSYRETSIGGSQQLIVSYRETSTRGSQHLIVIGPLALVLSAAIVRNGLLATNVITVAAGTILFLFGLTLTGVGLPQHATTPTIGLASFVLGAGLTTAGVLMARASLDVVGLQTGNLVFIYIVTSMVVFGALSWLRYDVIVLVVLLIPLATWIAQPRTTGQPSDPNPAASQVLVAVGDSFISGEGTGIYFQGTDQAGDDGNSCRRSPRAYPHLIASELDLSLEFLACSGATTNQLDGDPEPGRPVVDLPGADDQLARLRTVDSGRRDAVTLALVSIGGNDAAFATIVKSCLLPGDCGDIGAAWLEQVDRLEPSLAGTYRRLATELPNARILAMPYPQVVDDRTCGRAVTAPEGRFLRDFTSRLNRVVRAAADSAGVEYVASAEFALDGHHLCDAEPGINFLDLSPPDGPLRGQLDPRTWINGSLHPSVVGHSLLASAVASHLSTTDGPRDETILPSSPRAAPESVDLGESDEATWIRRRLFEAVSGVLAAAGLLAVGGLLGSLGLLGLLRPRISFLEP